MDIRVVLRVDKVDKGNTLEESHNAGETARLVKIAQLTVKRVSSMTPYSFTHILRSKCQYSDTRRTKLTPLGMHRNPLQLPIEPCLE